jgi:hypothetical protein
VPFWRQDSTVRTAAAKRSSAERSADEYDNRKRDLMFNLIGFFMVLFIPTPTTPPVAAPVAVVAPAPAPVTVAAATTGSVAQSPAPVTPTPPSVTTTLTDCTVTWTDTQTEPQTGATVTVTQHFEGSCADANTIAATNPGAVVGTFTFPMTTSPGEVQP